MTLPGEFDADNIEASLEGGILTLRVPKPERAKPRRIEIKGG
ncbi:MAG: Hsp20 family protein [Actinomycetota bacterium]|nr:Hsp20 family protein [Actinomycetota bacterium]